MVREKRAIFGADDICTLRAKCSGCSLEVLISLDCRAAIPFNCPHCDLAWQAHGPQSLERQLLETLVNLRDKSGKKRAVEIKLEILEE